MAVTRDDDPPDYPEHPECCGEPMTVDGNILRCEVCRRCEEIVYDDREPMTVEGNILRCEVRRRCEEIVYDDRDPGPEPVVDLPDYYFKGPEKCPHGNEWHECDACAYLSDLAYDASREKR